MSTNNKEHVHNYSHTYLPEKVCQLDCKSTFLFTYTYPLQLLCFVCCILCCFPLPACLFCSLMVFGVIVTFSLNVGGCPCNVLAKAHNHHAPYPCFSSRFSPLMAHQTFMDLDFCHTNHFSSFLSTWGVMSLQYEEHKMPIDR